MDYMTTKEVAVKWKISDRRVLQYCNDGRIDGAEKMGNTWLILKMPRSLRMDAFKHNSSKKQKGGYNFVTDYKIMIVDDEPDILDLLEKSS